MLTPIPVYRPLPTVLPSSVPQRTLSVTTVAPPDAAPIQTADDILDDLAARLEQDLDYQILRQSFDLDSKTSLRLRHDTAEEQQADVTAASTFVALKLRFAAPAPVPTQQEHSATLALTLDARPQRTVSVALHTTELEVNIATADPLVLDLSGAGIATTGVAAGVRFDLDGDGQQEQISTVAADTWLLALDRNGNGVIDDGRELFGDQHGAAHGFAELARHDADASGHADGVIDANDAVFSQLRLLQFAKDGTQVSQTLTEAGVTALELGYQNTRKALNLYDTVAQTAQFQRTDGSSGETADILLGLRHLA
jgi:hypothetical protein